MRAVVRVAVFSGLLVLLIVGGLKLGHSVEGPEPLPPAMAALQAAGAELVPIGGAGVLDGWLVRKADGSVLTVYVAPGGYLVAGLLYGADGLELTGGQVRAAAKAAAAVQGHRNASRSGVAAAGSSAVEDAVRAAAAGYAPAAGLPAAVQGRKALFERALAVAAFTLGEAGPDVVAFIDPGCPWSRQAAAEQGARALDGAFRLHAVPVGLMGGDSLARAAGIAASDDPALAWFGSKPAGATTEEVVRLEANNALWRAFGAEVVPFFAWRGQDGSIGTHAGLPESPDFMDPSEGGRIDALLMDLGREGLR